jgi:hypothetical protein
MARIAATIVAVLLTSPSCFAAPSWSCKPVWSFSGMGNKTYEGVSDSEASAKSNAREKCVADNRGLELDDFCVDDPRDKNWHCAPSEDHVGGFMPKT